MKSIRLAAVAALMIGFFQVKAEAYSDVTFLTSTNNGVVTIIGYDGIHNSFTIPATDHGLLIGNIGPYAFDSAPLTSVRLLNTLTNIGDYAFQNCRSLVSIKMQNTLSYIGDGAFIWCRAFTNVTLPDSLKTVRTGTFLGCTNLASATMSNNITRIEAMAFSECSRLKGLVLSTNLVFIGSDAFSLCRSLTALTLPAKLTNIGDRAFSGSGLNNITVPRYVRTVGVGAFSYCPDLESIGVHASSAYYSSAGGVLFNKAGTRLVEAPGLIGPAYDVPAAVTDVVSEAFSGCERLASVGLPKGVVAVGARAFEGCTALKALTLPVSIRTIGSAAFARCVSLTNATILAGPAVLPEYLFSGCSKLARVSIPGSVVALREGAFYGCSKLTSLVLPASVTNIGSFAFCNDANLKYIYCLGAPPHVDTNAFYNASNATFYYYPGTPGWPSTLGGRPAAAMKPIPVKMDKAVVLVPEGGTTALQIRPGSQPVADMVVTVARTGGDGDITLSGPASFTFTPANWSTYKTVTLAAAEDNGEQVNGSATFTFTGLGVSNTVVAVVEADDDYTLDVDSVFPSVTIEPAQVLYDGGTVVTLTAQPVPALAFIGWTGDVSSAVNPLGLVMNADRQVKAVYRPFAPGALPPSGIAGNRFTARWKWLPGDAPEGELNVAWDAAFAQPVSGYEGREVVNGSEWAVTNLLASRDYWYRVRRVLPDGTPGPWSGKAKVRTGALIPWFRNLLSEVPVSKGVTQAFPIAGLTGGIGTLSVRSSNLLAVQPTVSGRSLLLKYGWGDTSRTARITLTLLHPATGYRVSYQTTVTRAGGSVFLASVGALTNITGGAAQELILENRTGGMISGVRVRVLGLDQADWLLNQTGVDPVTRAPIVELPCLLPAGSQTVVRLVYDAAYKTQAQTAPAAYKAWAVMPPHNDREPVKRELWTGTRRRYDGLWLVGQPAIRNRHYAVLQSDDGGSAWTTNTASLRATAQFLMFMDLDEAAPDNRLYRFLDQGL